MNKISVVIITLNEERDIARCLNSVKEIADEIVVVDSFSTDKTEDICAKFNAKFIKHKFEGYILQKNFALTQAANNIVLSLDADEELSVELQKSILEIKKDFQADGYSMNRITRIGEHWIKHSGWYPDTKLRLFDCSKGEWAGLNPHDEFKYFKTANIQKLHGDLLHHSFYSFEELEKQTVNFARLGAKAYYEKGKKAPLLKVWFNPVLRFTRDYIFNKGVFNGKLGLKVSLNNAKATYLKYNNLRVIYLTKKK